MAEKKVRKETHHHQSEVTIIAVEAARKGSNFKNYVEALVSKEAERLKRKTPMNKH